MTTSLFLQPHGQVKEGQPRQLSTGEEQQRQRQQQQQQQQQQRRVSRDQPPPAQVSDQVPAQPETAQHTQAPLFSVTSVLEVPSAKIVAIF
jgi:hypothetical protein